MIAVTLFSATAAPADVAIPLCRNLFLSSWWYDEEKERVYSYYAALHWHWHSAAGPRPRLVVLTKIWYKISYLFCNNTQHTIHRPKYYRLSSRLILVSPLIHTSYSDQYYSLISYRNHGSIRCVDKRIDFRRTSFKSI